MSAPLFEIAPIDGDLDATLALWQAHWDEQQEETLRPGAKFNPALDYFRWLESQGHFYYITVRKEGELVGHFGLGFGINKQTSGRVAGDDFFYIRPEHRGGGIGSAMVNFAKQFAFVSGAEEFSVSYRTTVDDLGPLLERKCGMKKIATVYTVRKD